MQRRAHLVADAGEKDRLGPFGGQRLVAGGLDLFLRGQLIRDVAQETHADLVARARGEVGRQFDGKRLTVRASGRQLLDPAGAAPAGRGQVRAAHRAGRAVLGRGQQDVGDVGGSRVGRQPRARQAEQSVGGVVGIHDRAVRAQDQNRIRRGVEDGRQPVQRDPVLHRPRPMHPVEPPQQHHDRQQGDHQQNAERGQLQQLSAQCGAFGIVAVGVDGHAGQRHPANVRGHCLYGVKQGIAPRHERIVAGVDDRDHGLQRGADVIERLLDGAVGHRLLIGLAVRQGKDAAVKRVEPRAHLAHLPGRGRIQTLERVEQLDLLDLDLRHRPFDVVVIRTCIGVEPQENLRCQHRRGDQTHHRQATEQDQLRPVTHEALEKGAQKAHMRLRSRAE